MEYIEIEYNRNLKPLEAVLSRVKQPGDFFVSGTVEMPMPRMEVEGAGVLSFPVPDAQIAAIVSEAERAPYGRGSDTIVDTSVRSVWQISPGKIKIGGKSWAANFETILSKVRAGLGCGDAIVSAELYKALVRRIQVERRWTDGELEPIVKRETRGLLEHVADYLAGAGLQPPDPGEQ